MAMARARRGAARAEYWPSFVDVLTNLLLVFIFLLSIFALVQFVLSREISGRDTVLQRLNQQISELTRMLALERASKSTLTDNIVSLQASLSAAEVERDRIRSMLDAEENATTSAGSQISSLSQELQDERQISERALSQVELLNQQISALRRQIAALEDALEVSEERDRESQTQIADLGRRLNVALAQRVQELNRYRSDFFGRLRQILGDRPDIRIVGDRFVFQSEVFFGTGSDELSEEGQREITAIADAISELNAEIPPEINWVLRVDGHTDKRPINNPGGRFQSNWDLSASRAISVVSYLVDQGVPPNRLLAAGFGEFQPIEEGDSEEVLARNRRIELKLTER